MLFNAILAAALVLLPQAMASPLEARDLECVDGICRSIAKRDVCNADNALRALRNSKVSAEASLFCSTYIQPVVTGTTTLTTTAATATATFTPNTVTRCDAPLPSYIATFPPSRISSACSCFINPSNLVATTQTLTSTASITATTTTTLPAPTATATETIVVPIACGPAIVGCTYDTHSIGSTDPKTSVDQCRIACSATPNCVAFQFGPARGVCNLFNAPAADDSAGVPVPACNAYKIYNLSECPAPSSA
ncbi:MAG: hypothetical protein M1829_006851 [Trizodia sp. TS-e1964]|nr:MAG: hypothetical protein M1829_006851 [Trizodia sp. TS-e1964]